MFLPPAPGNYWIRSVSDDGIRVSINNQWVIDNWTDHGETVDTATVALTAGVACAVVVEYFENTGYATCHVTCQLGGEGANLFEPDHVQTSSSYVQFSTRPVLGLARSTDDSILLKLRPEGRNVSLEISTDLINWSPVTAEPEENMLSLPVQSGGIFYRLTPPR